MSPEASTMAASTQLAVLMCQSGGKKKKSISWSLESLGDASKSLGEVQKIH